MGNIDQAGCIFGMTTHGPEWCDTRDRLQHHLDLGTVPTFHPPLEFDVLVHVSFGRLIV